MLLEQLEICLRELKILEKASSMDEAWLTMSKLLAAQEHKRKEMEEQMAEEAVISKTSKLTTKNWLTIRRNLKSSPKCGANYRHCSDCYC